jgi:hypothetical protein
MPNAIALSATLLSLAVLTGCAQDSLLRQDASIVKSADCAANARKALHDHGLERGYGPMPVKACDRT